jgi:integrase
MPYLYTAAYAPEKYSSWKWQDINFGNNRLFVKDRKNGGNALLPMHEKVKGMFLRWRDTENTGYVFKSTNNKKINEISNAFIIAVERLGLNTNVMDRRQKVVFHMLRYTYASWLVINGIDLYTVQPYHGTQGYNHALAIRAPGSGAFGQIR